jgi:hypothetical protein
VTCGWPWRLELRAKGRHEEHRQTPDLFHRQVQQLARTWIGPMQVLEDHQYVLLAGQAGELPQ